MELLQATDSWIYSLSSNCWIWAKDWEDLSSSTETNTSNRTSRTAMLCIPTSLPDAEERIYDKISDITVSMKAVDHLKMPKLVSTEYAGEDVGYRKEKYKELKDELILEVQDTEITAANAAALSNKLCQMSNGAIYDDEMDNPDERDLMYKR